MMIEETCPKMALPAPLGRQLECEEVTLPGIETLALKNKVRGRESKRFIIDKIWGTQS